jgi:hypothetical protein
MIRMVKNDAQARKIVFFIPVFVIMLVLIGGCTTTPQSSPNTPTKTTTLIPTRTFTPTPTLSPTIALKTVLFSDDLSHWRSEWASEYDNTDAKIFYSGGSLHIRDNKPPIGTPYHTLNKNFNDFILDVDTKLIDGTVNNWQGVDVRSQDDNNYYDFAISADGYYTIIKAVNGTIESLIGKPTRSSYINTGMGATNHLHVEANKNTLSLSVNGHLLRTVTDNTFKEGSVDLSASCLTSNSFTEVSFNNLVITII